MVELQLMQLLFELGLALLGLAGALTGRVGVGQRFGTHAVQCAVGLLTRLLPDAFHGFLQGHWPVGPPARGG